MLQVVEQTHDEKVAMYVNTCTKEELAEMLIMCNVIIDAKLPARVEFIEQINSEQIKWDNKQGLEAPQLRMFETDTSEAKIWVY